MNLSELSKEYRGHVCECLMNTTSNNNDDDDNNDDGHYQSLAAIYATMHLNEIYLLPATTNHRNARGHQQQQHAVVDKLEGPPGSLTADTVRYLRLHHCYGELNSNAVLTLLDMDQPEYYTTADNNDDNMTSIQQDPLLMGPFPQPYYNLLMHLINVGQVKDAWAVLTRHSSCRRVEEEAMRGEFSKEGEAWTAFKAILLSAPLPGGRGEGDDSGLVEDINVEEDVVRDANVQWMQGVSNGAPCLWEAFPKTANRERNELYRRQCLQLGLDLPMEHAEVMPERYSEGVAMNVFTHWQREVKLVLQPGRMGDNNACSALFSRFPQLEQIFGVLLGRSPVGTGSWSEMLVCELLYSRPNMRVTDISVRARVAMRNDGVEVEGGRLESMVLKVMEGSVEDVVVSLMGFGGGSGAALPATLVSFTSLESSSRSVSNFISNTMIAFFFFQKTCLVSNLLVDSGIIRLPSLQTELLLAASESIVSSFSIKGQSDVGVRTAVRLLLPYSPPKRVDGEICYEPRIAATISETISHRYPDSDSEAENLLNITEDMIRLGSVRIADAVESLSFCRATHHASKGEVSIQIYWLLRGIEIMAMWLPEGHRRTLGFASRRNFDLICEESADMLLSCLAAAQCCDEEDQEKLTEKTRISLNRASIVLATLEQHDSIAVSLKDNVEVALLHHVVRISNGIAKGDFASTAVHIIHCLEERSSGVVTTLAKSDMYLRLLNIAINLLNDEETLLDGSFASTSCVFSTKGMHILMARMNQVIFWEGKTSEKAELFSAMRMILCRGLMRAFASVDAQKDNSGEKIVDLNEEVAMMLAPSI